MKREVNRIISLILAAALLFTTAGVSLTQSAFAQELEDEMNQQLEQENSSEESEASNDSDAQAEQNAAPEAEEPAQAEELQQEENADLTAELSEQAEEDVQQPEEGEQTDNDGADAEPALEEQPEDLELSETLTDEELETVLTPEGGYDVTQPMEVADEDDLIAAVSAIQQAAAAGETVNTKIVLTADIALSMKTVESVGEHPNKSYYYLVQLPAEAVQNLEITSAQGEHYTLSVADSLVNELKNVPNGVMVVFFQVFKNTVSFSNITIDGSTYEPDNVYGNFLLIASDATVDLNEGTVVTNFETAYLFDLIFLVGCTLNINGAEIVHNISREATRGSLIYSFLQGNIVFNSGKISDNDIPSITVTDNAFYRTPILLSGSSTFTMNGGEISGNFNPSGFGAVGAISSTVEINGGKIFGNTCRGGGGVAAVNSLFTMNGGEIYGNKAVFPYGDQFGDYFLNEPEEYPISGGGESGGGVMLQLSNGIIRGGSIHDNYSDTSGGGLTVFQSANLVMSGGEIRNNTSELHGGGIEICGGYSTDYEDRAVVSIRGGSINGNTAKSIINGEEHNADVFAPGGGGIFIQGGCELYFSGGSISGNKTENYGSGGAIFGCFNSYLEMNGGVIEDNISANDGGGIYMDGAGNQEGFSDPRHFRGPDDNLGTGSYFRMQDGRISGNAAGGNGGGIYLAGDNTLEVDGETVDSRGASMVMLGGVITANHAKDQGGGIFLQNAPSGTVSSAFYMQDGAIYYNIAGDQDNTSSGTDAGAEVYAEGGNTILSLLPVSAINAAIANEPYTPEQDRSVWFMDWYDDYADADSNLGKGNAGKGMDSGRYMTSLAVDRITYTPENSDHAFRALILERSTDLVLKKLTAGENVPEDQLFQFRIELVDVPDSEAGIEYSVETDSQADNGAIKQLASGVKCIRFPATVSLKSDEQLTVQGLPDGTRFKITEVDAGGAASTKVSVEGGEKTATDNAKKTASGTTVAKLVDNSSDGDRSDVTVERVTTVSMENTFVKQEVKPISIQLPVVIKTVKSTDKAPEETFQFAVEQTFGDCYTGPETFSITGEGTYTFTDTVTVSQPGTYAFGVMEIKGKTNGYSYDTSTWMAVYEVTLEGNELVASCTVYHDDHEVEMESEQPEFNFVNTYSKPGHEVPPKEETPPPKENHTPKTGDSTLLPVWGILGIAAAGGLVALLLRKKKR